MPNLLCGPWLTVNDCWLNEWMVELGIEVSSEHETCTVLFQQCDQCSEVLSQEQESSRGSGGGGRGVQKLVSSFLSIYGQLRERSHRNLNNSTFFGRSFSFKEAFGIKCLPPVSMDFQDCRIQRQYDTRDSVEARVRDPGFPWQLCNWYALPSTK